MTTHKMELLAPAGDMEALRAAVQCGADAVYLGTGAFNARRRAGNFDGDGLKAAVDYCHLRHVKVHVTLNTLIRQEELPALQDTIRQINQSGADAVIVQDFGAAKAVRAMAPTLQLHASTQMAAHNPQAARFLKAQGFDRVVLAREATFEDMAHCVATGLDTEVFVHGALCTACSGQCLMSSLVGGRSGNRGLCAQPCRLPWQLEGQGGYLLSTRDLCAIDDLPRLREIGVKSLKIEGRLKRAEYVAVTVAAYRQALDALYEGLPFDTSAPRQALAQMFNRGGFTRGYAPGISEGELIYPERPNHLGVQVGACTGPGSLRLTQPVLREDALVLRRGAEDSPVQLSGAAGATLPCPGARRGDRLIRLVSQAQMAGARQRFAAENRLSDLSARLSLHIGQPARLTASDGRQSVSVSGDVLQPATGRPFDPDRARGQLRKTGGTPWRFDDIQIDADEEVFVPASMLNALRRDALSALEARYTAVQRSDHPMPEAAPSPAPATPPMLLAQSADVDVLRRALSSGADLAVYAPDDLVHLRDDDLPERFALALPAVLTEAALNHLNRWANAMGERIAATYLGNIGHFDLSWPGVLKGDYMLNIANDLTTDQLEDWGLEAITPSVELTAGQIRAMGGTKELIMWGRLPLMHLRHCPLRAINHLRGRHEDCRHCDHCAPGDRLNQRSLVDRRGAAFPMHRVAMDGGCVIQILNTVPLMPLNKMEKLPRANGWRLLLRSDEPVEDIVSVYRAALNGAEFRRLAAWRTLQALDTTTGHYFRGVE